MVDGLAKRHAQHSTAWRRWLPEEVATKRSSHHRQMVDGLAKRHAQHSTAWRRWLREEVATKRSSHHRQMVDDSLATLFRNPTPPHGYGILFHLLTARRILPHESCD
jgi:hypothetical protein